jgi:hypothetical protein
MACSGSGKGAASMVSKPLNLADLDRLARLLAKAQQQLGIEKGSPEFD